jgi:hypothetical protein
LILEDPEEGVEWKGSGTDRHGKGPELDVNGVVWSWLTAPIPICLAVLAKIETLH